MIKNRNNGKTKLPSNAILAFNLPEERKNALFLNAAFFILFALREETFTIVFSYIALSKESTFPFFRFLRNIVS